VFFNIFCRENYLIKKKIIKRQANIDFDSEKRKKGLFIGHENE